MPATDYRYDVFVSYSHADRAWVWQWLMPRLKAAGLAVCTDHESFDIGVPVLVNMENAVATSRHTILVLTPAWVASQWAQFEGMLAQHHDPASLLQRTLPLLRQPCDVPQRIALLTYADLTGDLAEADETVELARLIDAARDVRRLPQVGRALVGLGRPAPYAASGLDSAQRLLAALPLDSIPDVAPLPPGSRMPLAANPLFVGRADDLKALAAALKTGTTTTIAATTGMGGIGKTQLASEFVHRYGQFFAGGVFWLSFADPQALRAEIADCGSSERMGVAPAYGSISLEGQVKLVLAAWQAPLPRLLVFDNCEDEALVSEWRPTSGGCRVLITSRRAQWDPALGVRTLGLGVLPRAESVALLRTFRPDLAEDDPQLDALAAELGDLPLALHLAGSYLARYRHLIIPSAYLTQLRSPALLQHPSMQSKQFSPTDHRQHVGRTFALSYERLDSSDAIDALALKLLVRAACFVPGESVPRDLLLQTLDLADDDLAAQLQSEDALARLVELGLIEIGSAGDARMHRLLVIFVQELLAEPSAQEAVEYALLERARELGDAGYPAPLLALQRHLRYVIDTAATWDDERMLNLATELSYHLRMIGDYAGALSYLERIVATDEMISGPDHPTTANSLNNLAEVLSLVGDYARARPLLERSVEIRERALGPDNPDLAVSLSNLGSVLKDQGDYAGARSLLERALRIWEAALGPEHPYVATALNNLAVVVLEQAEYATARSLLERALSLHESQVGPEHPDVAMSLNNLGWLLRVQGDYAEARRLSERAIAIWEQTLGPQHPYITMGLNNLGELLRAQGEYAAARTVLERATQVGEHALGNAHPQFALSLNNLGMVLWEQGDYAAARPLLERALHLLEQTQGAEHPQIALGLNNLGLLLLKEGDYPTGLLVLEQALAMTERTLGAAHPQIAISLNNLGVLRLSHGDPVAARPLLERALRLAEQALGPSHPQIALSLNNLGKVLLEQGDYAAARPLLERALHLSDQVLGPAHAHVAVVLSNLAEVYVAEGEAAQAVGLLRRALAIDQQALGEDHPDTLNLQLNLSMTEQQLLPGVLPPQTDPLAADHDRPAHAAGAIADADV
jgi:tetratricopeptide (TPR) repeat protein